VELLREDFISGIGKIELLKIKASYGKIGTKGLDPYQKLWRSGPVGNDGGIR